MTHQLVTRVSEPPAPDVRLYRVLAQGQAGGGHVDTAEGPDATLRHPLPCSAAAEPETVLGRFRGAVPSEEHNGEVRAALSAQRR